VVTFPPPQHIEKKTDKSLFTGNRVIKHNIFLTAIYCAPLLLRPRAVAVVVAAADVAGLRRRVALWRREGRRRGAAILGDEGGGCAGSVLEKQATGTRKVAPTSTDGRHHSLHEL